MSGQAGTCPVGTGRPEAWERQSSSGSKSPKTSHVFDISRNVSNHRDWVKQNAAGNLPSYDAINSTLNSDSVLKSGGNHVESIDPAPNSAATTGDVSIKRKRQSTSSVCVGGSSCKQVGRKRRKTADRSGAAHPKFLMGGSIKDPLNLNSLYNEEVSRMLNAATPISSPLPHVNKDPNPVIVPLDSTDPLKLNVEADKVPANLTRTLTPKSTGKKRKKRLEPAGDSHSADEATPLRSKPSELNLDSIKAQHHAGSTTSKFTDKIVSPVFQESSQGHRKRKKQEPTAKIARALLVEVPDAMKTTDNDAEKRSVSAHPQGERATPEKRKYKRQTSKDSKPHPPPKFRDRDRKFQYGNYHRYYGYRNPDQDADARIPFLNRVWFENKTCLDIGCNAGHVTLHVARNFAPTRITGVDIDGVLVGVARKNIRHCIMEGDRQKRRFPVSMEKMFGPINSSICLPKTTAATFPGNILFRCANYVPESDALLEMQKPEFDTILCLSVTKWIHLNWGDAGLKRMFRRIYLALHPGGRFILEAQGWPSYMKKKKLTDTTYKNFKLIQLKPDKFKDYLLSSRVGFSSCETIGTPVNKSKGFRRPILMFTKLTAPRPAANVEQDSSHERSDITAILGEAAVPPVVEACGGGAVVVSTKEDSAESCTPDTERAATVTLTEDDITALSPPGNVCKATGVEVAATSRQDVAKADDTAVTCERPEVSSSVVDEGDMEEVS